MRYWVQVLVVWFLASVAGAQATPTIPASEPTPGPEAALAAPEPIPCPEDHTCVPDGDMAVFVKLLHEKKCLNTEKPKFELDSVVVITDHRGRVYFSGAGPKPYKLKMSWCNYDVEAQAEVETVVAMREEPTWGFRPRLKATFGILLTELVEASEFSDALDGGLLFEPFYVHWVNLNAYVGVRSFGAGVGFDITTNFGGYAGYSLTWGGWRSNPFVSVFFSF